MGVLNAAQTAAGQLGGVLETAGKSLANVAKTWFSGDGVFAGIWSAITSAFDNFLNTIMGWIQERPIAAIGAVAGIVLLALLLGPKLLGGVLGGLVKSLGKVVRTTIRTIRDVVTAIWRR